MVLTTQPADGLWTSQLKNNARQGRSFVAAFLENADATPGNGTRSGVIVTTGLNIASDLLAYNLSGLNLDIAPGAGVAHLAGQGPMLGFLNAVKTVRFSDPPASNPRNDIVILRMYNLAGSDVSPDGQPCRIEIVTGTPNAVPVDPVITNANGTITAIPVQAGLGTGGIAIPIARGQVSTGGVVTLTDIRKSAGVVGGPRYMLPGDAGDTAGRTGQLRYNPATDALEVKNSAGTWLPVAFGLNIPQGWIGSHKPTASVASVGTTETVACAVTFTGVSGRRVFVQWQGDLSSTSTTTGSGYRLRFKQTASQTDVTGTLISGRDAVTNGGSNTSVSAFGDFVCPASATITVVATIRATNGAGNAVQAYDASNHIPNLSLNYAGA